MTTAAINHAPPLAGSLADLGRLSSYIKVEVGQPAEPEWVQAEALLAPDSPQLAALLEQIGAHHRLNDRRFVGMVAFNNIFWQLSAVAVGASIGAGRVPDLRPANLAMRFNGEGWPVAVALAAGRFAALPADPDASHPDAAVVADGGDLRAAYLSALRDNFVPRLIEALGPHTPLGARTLWTAHADQLIGMALWLGKELGSLEVALREVEAIAAAIPQASKSGVFWVEWGGKREPFVKRGSCCYNFKLPGAHYCASCPLQSIGERTRRLQESMATG
jgi:hypothetical protein